MVCVQGIQKIYSSLRQNHPKNVDITLHSKIRRDDAPENLAIKFNKPLFPRERSLLIYLLPADAAPAKAFIRLPLHRCSGLINFFNNPSEYPRHIRQRTEKFYGPICALPRPRVIFPNELRRRYSGADTRKKIRNSQGLEKKTTTSVVQLE